MSKSNWLHIVFLCIGLFIYSEASASINYNTNNVVFDKKDSLKIDTSSIEKRHFNNLKERALTKLDEIQAK